MGRVHFGYFFRESDEYVVLSPACPPEVHAFAAGLPVHAVGRTRIGGWHVYSAANSPVLFTFLRSGGYTVCGACHASAEQDCGGLFDDEWLEKIGMTRTATVSDWERIWDAAAEALRHVDQRPSLGAHEAVLGLTPPYTDKDVQAAFRKAALKTHPDRPGGSAAMFNKVCEAKKALAPALG